MIKPEFGIIEGKGFDMKEGFKITGAKGFHMIFPNGWCVSVQFGYASYCKNYEKFETHYENFSKQKNKEQVECEDAEVWCWNQDDSMQYPQKPLSNQSPMDVLRIMNKISSLKPKEEVE